MSGDSEVAPTVNMNIYIQNYTNINNFHLDSLNPKHFQKEFAKPQPSYKRVFTPPLLETAGSHSTLDASPRSQPQGTPKTLEELQVAPTIAKGKQNEIYEKRGEMLENNNVLQLIGVLFVAFAVVLFIGTVYAILISPFVGKTGHELLDMVGDDIYYCCLIPFMMPVAFVFSYANWVSIKFFRHT